MKRSLFLLLALFLSVLANAQTWIAPGEGTFSDRFVIYVKLNVNGSQVTSDATIAAFIDDGCRGVVDEVIATNESGFYPLEVWGDNADNSKTVKFKAMYGGIAYTFTKTLSYIHQATSTPIPFVLNIDAITGLTLTNPININQKIGTTYNLLPELTYTYSTPEGSPYTKKGESAIDTSISTIGISWSYSSNNFAVGADGVLSVNHEGENDALTATLTVNDVPVDYITARTTVTITEPTVPVTSLTLSSDKLECWNGTDIVPLIEGMTTVLPADASNKNINVTVASGSEEGFTVLETTAGITAAKAGSWTVTVSSVDNPQIKKNITVVVKQHVTSLECSVSEITVDLDDDVFDKITKLVTVMPADATEKGLRFDVVEPQYINASGTALKEGNVNVMVYSKDEGGSAIPLTILVHIESSVNFTVPSELSITLNNSGELVLTNLTGKGFDPSLVSISIMDELATAEKDNTGLKFTVNGNKIGNASYTVYYNGRSRGAGTLYVDAEIALKAGWNWVSNYSPETIALKDADGYITSYFSGDNAITEMRTQNALLYNDPQYGMFGSISEINTRDMYKIYVKADLSLISRPEHSIGYSSINPSRKGYTWIVYNIIGDHSFDYFNNNNLLEGKKGDVIIGKDGFAEHDGSKWVASDGFKLETGKGYIYYKDDDEVRSLDYGQSYVKEQSEQLNGGKRRVMSRAEGVWEYNANAFADNMCIVARMNCPVDTENVTIGAFVNGECRGMGSFVKDDVMFINVAGNAGEKVTFRLYNQQTGEFYDVEETLSYTTRCGSLSAPVTLTSESYATGINNINSSTTDAPAFNISGQRVSDGTKGIIIKGGKKYFVK